MLLTYNFWWQKFEISHRHRSSNSFTRSFVIQQLKVIQTKSTFSNTIIFRTFENCIDFQIYELIQFYYAFNKKSVMNLMEFRHIFMVSCRKTKYLITISWCWSDWIITSWGCFIFYLAKMFQTFLPKMIIPDRTLKWFKQSLTVRIVSKMTHWPCLIIYLWQTVVNKRQGLWDYVLNYIYLHVRIKPLFS